MLLRMTVMRRKQPSIGIDFSDPATGCFGSVAAGSLRFSDSVAWGSAYGQKRTFKESEITPWFSGGVKRRPLNQFVSWAYLTLTTSSGFQVWS
jgi:hypothetical protein